MLMAMVTDYFLMVPSEASWTSSTPGIGRKFASKTKNSVLGVLFFGVSQSFSSGLRIFFAHILIVEP
jgi:hypothetical protein